MLVKYLFNKKQKQLQLTKRLASLAQNPITKYVLANGKLLNM